MEKFLQKIHYKKPCDKSNLKCVVSLLDKNKTETSQIGAPLKAQKAPSF